MALLGYPSLELSLAVLDLLRRMCIYSVSLGDRAALPYRAALQLNCLSMHWGGINAWHLTPHTVHCPQEAKAKVAAAGALPRVLALLAPSAPAALQVASMRLLTNLAFDRRLRRQMAKAGAAQRAAEVLLQQPLGGGGGAQAAAAPAAAAGASLQPLALGLLYLASMEPPGREAVALSDVLSR